MTDFSDIEKELMRRMQQSDSDNEFNCLGNITHQFGYDPVLPKGVCIRRKSDKNGVPVMPEELEIALPEGMDTAGLIVKEREAQVTRFLMQIISLCKHLEEQRMVCFVNIKGGLSGTLGQSNYSESYNVAVNIDQSVADEVLHFSKKRIIVLNELGHFIKSDHTARQKNLLFV